MLYKTSDKFIAYLALISGLSISAVAIYYSVAGLMAIFAAAVIPIMIMGIVLEVGKLAATVWLKQNWTRAPKFLKTYLLLAIFALMLLTSMGIFGYLSKAHLDQAVPTGDVAAKVALYDEKIKTERDNIETARTALKQMDAQVDARLSRSDDEKGAERAVQIRRQQQAERGRLQKDIADAQTRIAKLNEERAPIASELRKVEAEVGPIKYIAALIYGDQADQNLLERAVRWVIIVIVLVFDPLAVILLLASQYSFNWFRQQEEETPQEEKQTEEEPNEPEEMASDLYEMENIKDPEPFSPTASAFWPFPSKWKKEENIFDTIKSAENVQQAPYHPGYEDVTVKDNAGMDEEFDIKEHARSHIPQEEKDILDEVGVEQWNKMISKAEEEILREKEAKRLWKEENPDDTIKHQERLKADGVIDELPWEGRIKPDLTEVIEPESSKKKTTYIVKENNTQITKTKE